MISPICTLPPRLPPRHTLIRSRNLVLYTFAGHVFAPEQVAAEIGWPTSPFQYEVGMADLTVGVLGIGAFRREFGFRLATTIATVCWLGGDAIGHVRQIVQAGNYAPGNAGPWLYSDILAPLILCVTLFLATRGPIARASELPR